MIGGEAAGRILKEVLRGVMVSDADTPEEREYRERIKMSVDSTRAAGDAIDLQKEWT